MPLLGRWSNCLSSSRKMERGRNSA
jgi:hypothetical protein